MKRAKNGWTSADLAAMKKAIDRSAQDVQFAARTETYPTRAEISKLLRSIKLARRKKKNPHAVKLGRRGGKVKSAAKAKAARKNAKRGGWPKGRARKSKAS